MERMMFVGITLVLSWYICYCVPHGVSHYHSPANSSQRRNLRASSSKCDLSLEKKEVNCSYKYFATTTPKSNIRRKFLVRSDCISQPVIFVIPKTQKLHFLFSILDPCFNCCDVCPLLDGLLFLLGYWPDSISLALQLFQRRRGVLNLTLCIGGRRRIRDHQRYRLTKTSDTFYIYCLQFTKLITAGKICPTETIFLILGGVTHLFKYFIGFVLSTLEIL